MHLKALLLLISLEQVAGQQDVIDDNCFDLGSLYGRATWQDTELQTDLNMLLADASVLQSDSKVRTIKACYQDRELDPTLFSLQLEVWSRKTDESMWLSKIGHSDIQEQDCELLTPT